MKISQKAKNAIYLGIVCSILYGVVYVARNVLGAEAPQMISEGFSSDYIGKISSAFFFFYAVGQLVNGILGDWIKAKYMLSMGLLFAGIANLAFLLFADLPLPALLAYAMGGFFLSMIYGPMTKVISESTSLEYAIRCSLGYTFTSFFGSPLAGILAATLSWQATVSASSIALVIMAVITFISFLIFEKRGIVKYPKRQVKEKGEKIENPVRVLLRHDIIKFSIISILTGIIRTSVVFWLPTYFYQYLGFTEELSATIFTVVTLIISPTAFIAVFLYEKVMKKNMHTSVLLYFSLSAVCFALLFVAKQPILNICLICLGIMASNSATSILWSIYCPSLSETGLVSSATGFLDFLSYMAAAFANIVFPNAVLTIGWDGLILVWLALMVVGVVICLPFQKIFKKKEA